jgi:hypothetical protein
MINDGIEFDVQKILKLARQALSSAEVRRKFHRLDFWGPNEWYESQRRFFCLCKLWELPHTGCRWPCEGEGVDTVFCGDDLCEPDAGSARPSRSSGSIGANNTG